MNGKVLSVKSSETLGFGSSKRVVLQSNFVKLQIFVIILQCAFFIEAKDFLNLKMAGFFYTFLWEDF